jgi:hypothetical protein
MIRIEPSNESRAFLCDYCHQMYGATRGFVYRDDSAHALYYASLHDCGASESVYLAIGIGEREEEDGVFGDVRSVTFRVEPTETGVDISVVDAGQSPWGNARALGLMMNRDETLAHETFQEFLHIADHIVTGDRLIGEYLAHAALPLSAADGAGAN